jgi:two-component system chemotaxis sensor kinase CheA
MSEQDLIARLLASFVEELEGHVAALNRDLLELEKAAPAERGELIHALFRTTHTIKGAARAAAVSVVERATHALEDVLTALRDGSLVESPPLFELLFGVTDAMAEAGERIRRGESLDGASLLTFLPRLATAASLAAVAPQSSRGSAGPEAAARSAPTTSAATSTDNAIRVPPGRLDDVLDQSSELLVTSRKLDERSDDLGRLRALAASMTDAGPLLAAFDRYASNLHADARKLTGDLRQLDTTLKGLRMVPFVEGCRQLERAVRDLATSGGKEVALVIRGGEVELDRAILEGLRDPLLHLVRNAVDHAIELPAVRGAAGKPARGTITVAASLRGSEVIITVSDDGRGLDLEAIREQLRRRGLPEPARDEDLVGSVFRPGFSTARVVTDVSGRGVGLDAVKRSVEVLRGAIELSFEKGRGTVFTLAVPLTLTSLRAVLVRAGGRVFALPGTAVRRLVRVASDQLATVGGVQTVLVAGIAVPVVSLVETLGQPAGPRLTDGKASLVIVTAQGVDIAALVDELIEERNVVVQGLGARLEGTELVSGATVLPNGRLALILNPGAIVSRARNTSMAAPVFLERAAQERRRRVLLVDDSLTTRTLERSILESAGYEVTAASDGVEAWELLQERGADVVVSDVEMPRMDGFTLTQTIRSSPRFRQIPVVLVTGLAREEDRARGLAVGANAYLVKSAFDQQNLLETIAQVL